MLTLLPFLWFACSGKSDSAVEVNSCEEGETSLLVITELSYTLPDESDLINGFDLDQYVTEEGDDEGCGHVDMTSPAGVEGIDSAWSRLAPVLDVIGASQIQDYLQAAIDAGDLLIVLEFHSLDGPLGPDLNDDCAQLTIRRANGQPFMGSDGTILSDQTFHLDPSIEASTTVSVQFENGKMYAEGVDLTLPVQLLDEYVTLILNKSAFRFEIQEDYIANGYMAGGLPVDALKDRIAEIDDIGDLSEVIPGMVESAADLFPDDSGDCTEISLGLDFVAKHAYLFQE
jgi:hypothetical protein